MDDMTTEISEGLSAIRGLGAIAVECLTTQRETLRIGWSGSAPTKPESRSEQTARVGVWTSERRAGWAEGSGDLLALGRIAMDRASEPSELPKSFDGSSATELSIYDRRHGTLELQDREDLLRSVVASVKEVDSALSVDRLEWSEECVCRTYGSTVTSTKRELGTVYRLSVQVSGRRDGEQVMFSETQATRRFASLISMPIGTRVARRVVNALGASAAVSSGPIRVMLGSAATARILACVGEGYADGEIPPWLMRADGTFLDLHRRLHLIDDGRMPGGLRTRAFDDRGVPSQAVMLWRDGAVGARLIGQGAREQGPLPTGHMTAGGLQVSNLVLRAGARSLNAIAIARGGPSLYLEDIPSMSDAFDPTTGRFDGRVDGRLMEGNQVVGSFRGLRLQGLLSDVLRSVVDVASDTDRIGPIDAPGLVVDGFAVHSSSG